MAGCPERQAGRTRQKEPREITHNKVFINSRDISGISRERRKTYYVMYIFCRDAVLQACSQRPVLQRYRMRNGLVRFAHGLRLARLQDQSVDARAMQPPHAQREERSLPEVGRPPGEDLFLCHIDDAHEAVEVELAALLAQGGGRLQVRPHLLLRRRLLRPRMPSGPHLVEDSAGDGHARS